MVTSYIGDSPKHQDRRERKLDWESGNPERAADTAAQARQQCRNAWPGRTSSTRFHRFYSDVQASQNGFLDCRINARFERSRKCLERSIDRPAGNFREPSRERFIFQAAYCTRQSLRVASGKCRAWDDERHGRRNIGRTALRLARIAEPLLISAVTDGLINPPGRARPSARVFMPTTIA